MYQPYYIDDATWRLQDFFRHSKVTGIDSELTHSKSKFPTYTNQLICNYMMENLAIPRFRLKVKLLTLS